MFEGTIDWNEYWHSDREAETDFPANVGAYGKADLLARFFEQVGVPNDFASVGCGPADCPLELAKRYPEMDVYGYDAAKSVVCQNRKRLDGEATGRESVTDCGDGTGESNATDRANVAFRVGTLPEFDADEDRQFDLVYCYATLHYVREIERAVLNLYERVRPGGHLVFNYPSETTREFYHDQFDDEAAFRDRFELVFEGKNVTSVAEIEDALGASVHDYWAVVDADRDDGAAPPNPCVYVEK